MGETRRRTGSRGSGLAVREGRTISQVCISSSTAHRSPSSHSMGTASSMFHLPSSALLPTSATCWPKLTARCTLKDTTTGCGRQPPSPSHMSLDAPPAPCPFACRRRPKNDPAGPKTIASRRSAVARRCRAWWRFVALRCTSGGARTGSVVAAPGPRAEGRLEEWLEDMRLRLL